VEEFEKLDVQMNQEKTRIVDLSRDETFSFLGFDEAGAGNGPLGTAPAFDPLPFAHQI
jgi:hypothetical protein